jgi:phosphoribosylformylglycinamidine (FGAM) synthase PurS component
VRTFTRFPSSTKKITPEKAVQNAVIKILRFHGWLTQRNQAGLGNTKGRPDLEAYKNGFTLFIEVKAPKRKLKDGRTIGGELSEYQVEYIRKLKEQDMTVLVVDDSEKFLTQLEEIQERLWPGKGIRRLC